MRHDPEKLLVGIHARSAQLENFRRLVALHDPANRIRNIFHIGRLQPGRAAAEHRIDGKLAEEREDDDHECVVGSEHHCRTDEGCLGEGVANRQFALPACSDVA